MGVHSKQINKVAGILPHSQPAQGEAGGDYGLLQHLRLMAPVLQKKILCQKNLETPFDIYTVRCSNEKVIHYIDSIENVLFSLED